MVLKIGKNKRNVRATRNRAELTDACITVKDTVVPAIRRGLNQGELTQTERNKKGEITMKEEVIDMSRYVEAEPVVERCAGCKHVFDYIQVNDEGTIVEEAEKCRVYLRPEVKWPRKGEKFAMMLAKVRDIDDKGKPFTEEREVPIFPKSCPMATHYTPQIVLKQSEKVLVGQQKQKKKH